MTDNDKPTNVTADGPAELPEDRPPGRDAHSLPPRQSAELSDDLHAVARGGGATGSWMNRRREKIIAEIERNRRGEYKVPTWVLALLLVAILAAWASLIIFS